MEPPDLQPRPPTERAIEQASTEEEIAALIAGVLLGVFVLPEGMGMVEVVALLLLALPNPPVSSVADRVAELVVGDRESMRSALDGNLEAFTHNLAYQAFYAINAARRMDEDLDAGLELAEAEAREAYNHGLHVRAMETREAGAVANLAAARRFGPRLSWVHLDVARTHRPAHVRAHGQNYEVTSPPAATGGMLPGMEPNCDCVPGPPIPGARMMR